MPNVVTTRVAAPTLKNRAAALALAVLTTASAPLPLGATGRLASEPGTEPGATVITAADLEAGLYGYDLSDVLAALALEAGLAVKSSSDLGAEDWLLLRGLPRDSARNVLVLVDGMPLNDALSGSVELQHLPPLEVIDRIVVHKPPLPARFGGYLGAIEVFTRDAETTEGEIAAAAGGYGSRFASAVAGTSGDRFSLLMAVDYLQTDNLTGVRRAPPKETEVYGDRSYEAVKPVAKLAWRPGKGSRFSLLAQYVASEKLFSDIVYRDEREHRDRRLTSFDLGYDWRPNDDTAITAVLFRSDESYELNLAQHPNVRDQDRTVEGARVDGRALVGGRHALSFGGSATRFRAEERLGAPLTLDSVRIADLYLSDRIALADAVSLTVGLRLDSSSEAGDELSPSATLVYRPVENVHLHAAWSRSVRWPTLSELSAMDPALGLEGERLQGFELGATADLAPGRTTAGLTYFHLTLEDEATLVADFTGPFPRFYYANAPATVRSRGVEAWLASDLGRGWRASVNATWNEVVDRDDGEPIPYSAPEWLANGVLSYTRGRLSGRLEVRYGGEARGVQAMMAPPTELDRWLLVNLAGKVRVRGSLSAFARVVNLLDETYETFDGRPMFGRTAVAGASFTLR